MRPTALMTAAIAVTCLSLSACTSSPAGVQAPGRGRSAAVTTTAPSAAARATGASAEVNLQTARREARRLLSFLRLPPGVTRLPTAPPAAAGSGPAMGRPAVTSLVIDTEFWQADMPADQVVTWLASHTPAGLSPAGTSSSSGPSLDDDWAGFGYSDRANTAWQSAQLEVSVGSLAQSSTTSVIRADAVVVWLDPRPSPDNAAGQRARVTLAGGCPSSDAHLVGVTNPGAHLAASLLPAGAPTAALLCRYTGANGKTFALAHQARLGATAAQHLAKAVAKLPLSHVDGGVTSCPFGDGSAAVLAFSFPGRADVDLWVQTNGCATVANGYISTAAGDLPQLIEQYG